METVVLDADEDRFLAERQARREYSAKSGARAGWIGIVDAVGAERGVIVRHSMGAFVAVVAAVRHPDRVAAVVLVDGGLPLPRPAGMNVDEILEAMTGPAMARLSMTFRAGRPTVLTGARSRRFGTGTSGLGTYLDHDLVGDEPELRSSVSGGAVRVDAADTLEGDLIARALAGRRSRPCSRGRSAARSTTRRSTRPSAYPSSPA